MQKFKDYIDSRLSQQTFCEEYFQNCSICPTTIKIIQCIGESPLTVKQLANHLQIPVSVITNLEEAEHCCINAVSKLANYFKISQPETCLKDKVHS